MSNFSGQFKFQTPSGFVVKLRSLVDDPSNVDIISWSKNGNEIVIQDVDKFKDHLTSSSVFKTNNFSSFVRQLNMYGFHKVNGYKHSYGSKHPLVFEHPSFQRDKPHLLSSIRRFQRSKDKIELAAELMDNDDSSSIGSSFLTLSGPHQGNYGESPSWSSEHSPHNSYGSLNSSNFSSRMEGHNLRNSHPENNFTNFEDQPVWNSQRPSFQEQNIKYRLNPPQHHEARQQHVRSLQRRERPMSMPVSAEEYLYYFHNQPEDRVSPPAAPDAPVKTETTTTPPYRPLHPHQHSHSFAGWKPTSFFQEPFEGRPHSFSSNISGESSGAASPNSDVHSMDGISSNTKTIVDDAGKSHSVWRAF